MGPFMVPPAYTYQGSVGTGTHVTPGLPCWALSCMCPAQNLATVGHILGKRWRRGGDEGDPFQEELVFLNPIFHQRKEQNQRGTIDAEAHPAGGYMQVAGGD